MNQSRRGWVRFAQSLPDDMRAKGGGDEAMRGNPTMPAILRVDPSKPGVRERPKLWQNP
jgi:hypothetical protein